MIDLHCHILPGIDDGSKDLETSLQMCRIAKSNGIKHIVATPHVNAIEDIESFVSFRDEKIRTLRKAVEHAGIELNIYPGAEVFVDDDIYFANNLKRLSINKSRYILIEFSFRNLDVRRVFGYVEEIMRMDLIPIIAHPERFEFFQFDYDAVNALSDMGVLFQINSMSLASMDGPQEFELAYAMAYNAVASFIGTDAHSSHYRTNNLLEMMSYFPPDISQFNMQMMVHDAAKCVLLDQDLPRVERGIIEKRGF
ncbi:MAG: hypothetical protein IJT03_00240 [Clostridia bacterium]|nr:hypothetical protein [Clostridia bacterium]